MGFRFHFVVLACIFQLYIFTAFGDDQICSWNINKDYPKMLGDAIELTPDFLSAREIFESSGATAFQKISHENLTRKEITRAWKEWIAIHDSKLMKSSFGLLFNMVQQDTYRWYMKNRAFAAAKSQADGVCPHDVLLDWRLQAVYDTLSKMRCTDEPIMLQEVPGTETGVMPLMSKFKGRNFWAQAKGGEYGMLTSLPIVTEGARGLKPVSLGNLQLFPPANDREVTVTSNENDKGASRIADVGGGSVLYTLTKHQPSNRKILLMNVRVGSPEHDPKKMTPPEDLEPAHEEPTKPKGADSASDGEDGEDGESEVTSKDSDGETGGVSVSMSLEDRINVVTKPTVKRNIAKHLKPKPIDISTLRSLRDAVAKAMEGGIHGAIICGDFGDDISGVNMREFTLISKNGKTSRWEDAAQLTPTQRMERRRWTNLRISAEEPISAFSSARPYPGGMADLPLGGTRRKYLKWTSMTIDKTVDTHCYAVENIVDGKSHHGDIVKVEKGSFQQYNPTWYYMKSVYGEPLEYANREELDILPAGGSLTWATWMEWMANFPSFSGIVRFKYHIK